MMGMIAISNTPKNTTCPPQKRRRTGPAVLLEVRLDLGLALGPEGRLVDGEQHRLGVGGQHHGVEACILIVACWGFVRVCMYVVGGSCVGTGIDARGF